MARSVDRVANSNFERNHATAQRTAYEQLKFIEANLDALRKVDKHGRMEEAVVEFLPVMKAGDEFRENQLSYIDGIYEKTMKGLGFESVSVHGDRKAKGLRY